MITLNRKQLADSLTLLSSALEVRTAQPILGYMKLEAAQGTATLTTTRLDATLSVSVPCEGDDQVCLLFAPFRDAVKLAPDGQIKLQRFENRIEVIAGRSRHRLPIYETDAFPAMPVETGEKVEIDAHRLLDGVARVSPCADKRECRYAAQGVCIEAAEGELNVVTFDGTQAGIVRLMDSELKFQATVPNVAVPALRAVLADRDTAMLTVNENSLTVECEGRKMVTRLLLGTFPPWRMIVPKDTLHGVTLTSEVRDAIRRCCVTASEGNLVRHRLKLEFQREALIVQSYEGEGESIEEVPLNCPTLNGESLTVKVNADQLLAFLEQVNTPELRLKDDKSILLLTEGEHRYLHATLRPDA
jgi:DNA polymerase III sliding clamp (beta) subunit (PCNA family)